VYLPVATAAVALRAIPEVLAGEYPVGFDTLATYPYLIQSFPNWTLNAAMAWGPLFFGLVWGIHHVTGMSIMLLLKMLGPTLYSIFALSFALFLRKYLGWGNRETLVGSLILIFQPVTLRLSWDLFRNEMGLSLVFLSLVVFRSGSRLRNYYLACLSMLVVLTHQLSTIILFSAIGGILIFEKRARSSFLALLPSVVLFLTTTIWLGSGLAESSWFDPTSSQRVLTFQSSPSLLTNVFSQDFRFSGGTAIDVLAYVSALFLYCFIPLLFWALKGVFHEPALTTSTVALLIGSFSVILLPTASIPLYWRWEIMLVIPFAIYSAHGMRIFALQFPKRSQVLKIFFLLYIVLGTGYASGLFSYMYGSAVNSYMPGTMVQSSVKIDRVDQIAPCISWLNHFAPTRSLLVTDERFYALAMMIARPDIKIALQPGGSYQSTFFERIRMSNQSPIFVIDDSVITTADVSLVHVEGGIVVLEYLH